jgi:hypothetical protein
VAPRQSKNPKRRLAPPDRLDPLGREVLAAKLLYTGSALHKRRPGDYGFHPPVNPRTWKSLCDGKRPILRTEAAELLRQGLLNGLFSDFPDRGTPKYVWSVDAGGEVYEAKIDSEGYHGYRLEEEDDFRPLILKEWARRCSPR